MIKKKIGAVLGSLMLLAVALPLATAHLTSPTGSATSELLTGDAWRGNGVGVGSFGVSGTYINNPDSLYLTSSLFPLFIPDQSGGVTGDVVLFPLGYFSGASALCDLEVLSPGDGTQQELDEAVVDGQSNSDGIVDDGTWDDGGIGGACHTEAQYALGSYNTPGCDGTAFADDAVTGGGVFIGASCDETTSAGSSPSLTGCLINEAISGAQPAVLIDCIEIFVNGDPVAPVVTCGSDSIADSINYGAGGAGVLFPSSGCGGGTAAVFTFNYVYNDQVVPATAGYIDSTSGGGSGQSDETASWQGAATVVVEGFPASADEGFVVCSQARDGAGFGGFCVFEDVAAVYVEDFVEGADIAFQVCRDSNGDGICTNAETRFSHSNSGLIENPVAVPSGTGQIVVFICKGAHNAHPGPHQHHATAGTWEKRGTGGGFTDPDAYCGGSTGGGGLFSPPLGKRYVVTP